MEAQKTILRGLVTATPTAITVQQLAIEYRNTIGEPIPYQKFGYNSMEHFFRSIPDTIQVQGYGPFALVNPVVSNKSSHVMDLVSRQKIDTKRSNRYRGHRMPPMRRHVVNTDSFKNSIPNPRPQPQKMYYPPANTKTMISSQTTTVSNIKNSTSDNSYSLSDNSFENKTPTSFVLSKNAVIDKPPVSYKSSNTDPEVKQTTKAIEKTTLSTTAMKLRNSHSSSNLPEKDHDSTPSRSNNSFNKQTNSAITTESNNNIPMEDSEASVPVSVKNNLKNLIRQYPDGIWCAEVPGIYRKMFKRELKYQDLGFRNLIDLCMYLKSIFHYVRPSNEDFKLFDRSKPVPASAEQYFALASISSKKNTSQDTVGALPSLNWSDMESFLPPNVFKPGHEIPRTFVPDDTKENDTMDIVVGEIFDVSKFWIYKDDGKLDKLMDDIQIFYKENANEYRLPQDLIREGIYCVAVIIGEYHRALIIDSTLPTDDLTRVFFIDYGTMAKVKSELYFLHEKFAELPAQTIRCRLANICPPVKGAPWSLECSKEFRRIIKKRDLTAKISRVDFKDQYLEVFLADVTESHNVFYINNVLVENGFARFPDQEQENSIIDALSTPIVNLIHLFPTFVELEHGIAPSTLEMEIYHKCNTPINFCYPQYFNVDLSEEENIVKLYMEFWENNILKGLRKMLHHHHNIDTAKIKDKPFNFPLFNEVEEEIRDYLGEELSENHEEPSNHDKVINNFEKWNESLNDLREDCRLSEDIMNDLLNICDLNAKTDSEPNNDFNQTRNFNQTSDLLHSPDESSSVFNIPENEDTEAVYCNDEFEEYGGSFSKHPLQDLSFSRSNSSSNSTEYSESSDKYSYILNGSAKSDIFFNEEREESLVDDQVVNEEVVSSEIKIFNPNNPFLQNLDDEVPKGDILGCGILAPSNPFLTYIPKEDNSDQKSDSTASTDYGTLVQEVKVEKAWSTDYHSGSDMSISVFSDSVDSTPNTNNFNNPEPACTNSDQLPGTSHAALMNRIQLPRPVNNPVVTNNIQFPNAINNPVATNNVQFPNAINNPVVTNSVHLEHSVRSDISDVRPGLDISRPEFYPQNYFCSPQFYNYTNYPPMYPQSFPHPATLANPYYQQQHQQVYMRSSYNVMQTNIPSQTIQKPIGPPPGFGPNPQQSSGQCKDFYEAYNQILKQKFNH